MKRSKANQVRGNHQISRGRNLLLCSNSQLGDLGRRRRDGGGSRRTVRDRPPRDWIPRNPLCECGSRTRPFIQILHLPRWHSLLSLLLCNSCNRRKEMKPLERAVAVQVKEEASSRISPSKVGSFTTYSRISFKSSKYPSRKGP